MISIVRFIHRALKNENGMVFPFLKKQVNNCRTDLIACFDDTLLEMQSIAYVLTVHTSLKVILQINIEGVGLEFLGLSQRPYGLLFSAQEI
jgi:hypothetical protein